MGDGHAEALVWGKVCHPGYTVTPQHRFHGPAAWDISCWIHPAQQSHTGKRNTESKIADVKGSGAVYGLKCESGRLADRMHTSLLCIFYVIF